MASSFEFVGQARAKFGSSSARALRRQSKVPAVLYGAGNEVEHLVFDHNKIIKKLENEAVYSHVLTVMVDGQEQSAILKDVQRHPSRPVILHLDFQRVSTMEKIRVHVPLHFLGEDVSVGVKKGGIVMHNMVDLEVSCLPGRLPEFIEVDLSGVDVGESVHLSEIPLPAGIEIIELSHGPEHDLPVATIQASRVPTEPAGEAEEGSESDAD
ncbi:MAG: 50S ribosomal protein L25/general stress protein Ctc [Pseudomonadota bacterium]